MNYCFFFFEYQDKEFGLVWFEAYSVQKVFLSKLDANVEISKFTKVF